MKDLKLIEQEGIKKLETAYKKQGGDNEGLHIAFDIILLEVLSDIGMDKLVEYYNKNSEGFWYA